MAIVSSRAFEKQSSLDQLGNQILSRSSELDCEKVSMPAPDDRAEQTESNKPVRAAAQVANSAASPASPNAEKENRVPLRDITASLVLSDVVDRLNPPSTPNVLVSTTARTFSLQVAKVIQRELELPSRTPVMEPRETPIQARTASGNLLESPTPRTSPSQPPFRQANLRHLCRTAAHVPAVPRHTSERAPVVSARSRHRRRRAPRNVGVCGRRAREAWRTSLSLLLPRRRPLTAMGR
jgi:hypothetical protein